MAEITEAEVLAAQQEWGDGIVAIGATMTNGGDAAERAAELLDTLYAFDCAQVLFKPTKAAERQFRNDRDGALSYFVGGNGGYPEDHGFALQPWTKVRFENSGMILREHSALAMGNYFFTDTNGDEVKVEYSFGYIRDDRGALRINLHHSSLPYAA